MNNIFDISYWEQFPIKSYHNMNRYLNFIKSRIELGDRKLEYCEHHHIVPKSFDSSLSREKHNIIKLTAKEHYIAHRILARCFSGRSEFQMCSAYFRMCQASKYHKRNINASQYEEARKCLSISISNLKKGKKRSEETRRKISENHADFSGDKHPMYRKGYLVSGNRNGMYGRTGENSPNYGRKFSDETKLRDSIAKRGNRNPCYGKKWINNGIANKYIDKEDLDYYLSIGWSKGRIINKKG